MVYNFLALKLASACSDCMINCGQNPNIPPGQCSTVCASSCGGPAWDNGGITNPILGNLNAQTGVSFFQKFIPNLITLGLIIGVVIFFFILIVGAIQWISSGGDKNAIEAARSKITNAFVGIIILFAVFAILKVIESFFGITILTLDIGTLVIQ